LPGNNPAQRDALEAIMREAGAVARAHVHDALKHWTKGEDRSPVSEADIAVNDLLRERLAQLLPGAGWLSEETEDHLPGRPQEATWIVDPIDGTRAFISGRPDWTISVALVEHGRPTLAALYAPISEEMFLAARGAGTTCNGNAIKPVGGATLSRARLAGPKRYLDRLVALQPDIHASPKIHSLALRLTRVAQGALEAAFASHGSHDWDLAAADLLVHEAGGLLTDLAGQALTFNRPHITHGALLAAGPARHAALLKLVRERLPELA
jgi:myo-inositol-1(or 4)-monophosphatase